MELKRDPVPYIIAAGGPNHHLELGLIGRNVPQSDAELIAALVERQNGDGSWSVLYESGRPGSVAATARTAELLARAGNPAAAAQGAAWLAAQQRPEGGFAENAALADALKPEWDWISATHIVTGLTGEVILALVAAGGYGAQVAKARDLLILTRHKDGGWPGQLAAAFRERVDLWAVAGVVKGLLAAGIAANHPVFNNLTEALERRKDNWRNPVENPLPAFLALGKRLSDADVQECLRLAAESQNDDGGWPFLAGHESDPTPTVTFTVLFARYGLLPKN